MDVLFLGGIRRNPLIVRMQGKKLFSEEKKFMFLFILHLTIKQTGIDSN
jgi:hypothetical protein